MENQIQTHLHGNGFVLDKVYKSTHMRFSTGHFQDVFLSSCDQLVQQLLNCPIGLLGNWVPFAPSEQS